MAALVAKSYQGLEQVCDPYTMNGKQYVKVRLNNGTIKTVRAYSEKEYSKYNPEVKVIQKAKSQRITFGFGDKGFIWLFKGNTYDALDWFRWAPTRYAEFLGWYLPSDIEMPEPLPVGIEPVKLYWENVCNENGEYFRDKEEIKAYVETLVYDPGVSEWIGNIGERLPFILTCNKIFHFMNSYGETNMYYFTDEKGNIFTWATQTSKNIQEEHKYVIVGTIKQHTIYRNKKQTVLTRCALKKEITE